MLKNKFDLHKDIGEIIYKTSSVNFLAAQIISYYYLGNNNKYRISFIYDILTNEQTSLAFIANSLKIILLNLKFDEDYVKEVNDLESKIRGLGNLRNKFAHQIFLYNNGIHWLPDRKKVRWKGEGLNTKEEIDKFNILYNEITNKLNKIIKDSSIKIIEEIPDGYEPPSIANMA